MNSFELRFFLFAVSTSTIYFAMTASPSKNTALEERVAKLEQLSSHRSVIRLDSSKFNYYVKSVPRNYSMIIMLTAMQSQRQCAGCSEASSEFEIVANSWRQSIAFSSSLFFAMVDYDDGSNVFNTLHISAAPAFIHFPSKGKHQPGDIMDIDRLGFSAEGIAMFVRDRTKIRISILHPPDYAAAFLVLLAMVLLATLVYLKQDDLEVFYNKTIWATATLCLILTMTSGQMWNHIHGAPFFYTNRENGEAMYVHPWSDSQLVVETYIVFVLNAAVAFGIILLSEASTVKTNVGKRQTVALVGVGSFVFFFCLLMVIFRSKS